MQKRFEANRWESDGIIQFAGMLWTESSTTRVERTQSREHSHSGSARASPNSCGTTDAFPRKRVSCVSCVGLGKPVSAESTFALSEWVHRPNPAPHDIREIPSQSTGRWVGRSVVRSTDGSAVELKIAAHSREHRIAVATWPGRVQKTKKQTARRSGTKADSADTCREMRK